MHCRQVAPLIIFTLLWTAVPVRAESGVPLFDSGGSCFPGPVAPAEGRVPANLTAWRLRTPDRSSRGGPMIEFVQRFGPMDESREIEVVRHEDSYLLRPVAPLEMGGSYTIIDRTCEAEDRVAEYDFTVDSAVPMPVSLGVTTVSELRATRPNPGWDLRYHVVVGLDLSDGARTAALLYERTLSASRRLQTWRPAPLEDESQVLEVACRLNGSDGSIVSEYFHHLARLPGEEASLRTETVLLEVSCADAVRVDSAGEPLTPEEIEAMDRLPDAGPPGTMDAGTMPLDGSLQPDVSGMEPVEGCACRATGRTGSPTGLGLVAFVLFLSAARRRRRRRHGF